MKRLYGLIAVCFVSGLAVAEEPTGVETSIEMEIPSCHEFRDLLLKQMFELDESGKIPQWRWIYSREKFDAYKATYLEQQAKKRAAYEKAGLEWPPPKPSTFSVWWPDDTDVRACIFTSSWGGVKGGFYSSARIREMAKKYGLALVYFDGSTVKWACYPEDVFDEVLTKLGEKSGHPELSKLPFISYGHSNGSLFATACAMLFTDRCVAWAASHSNISRHFFLPNLERVPGFIKHGINDGYLVGGPPCPPNKKSPLSRDEAIASLRWKNAPVAFAMHPSAGHGSSGESIYDYIETMLVLRNPRKDADGNWILDPIKLEDGWLGQRYDREKGGEQMLEIKPYNEVPETERLKWNWLPTESFARKWQTWSAKGTWGEE